MAGSWRNAMEFSGRGFLRILAVPFLSALLFISLFSVPVVGGLMNPFAPLPVLYCFFRFGAAPALFAALFSAVIVGVAEGAKVGGFYFLGYALVALVLARLMNRQAGLSASVGIAAIVSFLATSAFFWALIPGTFAGMYGQLLQLVQKLVAEWAQTYKNAGVPPEQVDFMVQNSVDISKWIVRILPGSGMAWYLLLSLTNYLAYNWLQRRWTYLKVADSVPTTFWSPPEPLVFAFIAGLGLALIPNDPARIAGVNLLIVTFIIYTFAGLCVLLFWFDRIRFPKFLRLVIYILLLLQPFLIVGLSGTGLFDLWFDFRKIRNMESGKEDKRGIDT